MFWRCTLLCLVCCFSRITSGAEIVDADDLAELEAEPAVVIAPVYAINNPASNAYFFIKLLQLILDKTQESHGPYRLQAPDHYMVDNRLRAALAEGHVDVIWFTTFPEAEEVFLPIRTSLLGDITDYRLLLIRAGEGERFSGVASLDDLRGLTGGIGAQWVDADVMAFNHLPVIAAPDYGALFRMLAAGRFDYFSRGLYQIYNEVNRYPDLSLEIESTLMLHYPNAIYYFLNKNNQALAERLQAGLNKAINDGSYRTLFNQFEAYLWAEEQLRRGDRQVLYLNTQGQQE